MVRDFRRAFGPRWLLTAAALLIPIHTAHLSAGPDEAPAAAKGRRGPGLEPLDSASLQLPVPRTVDGTHVQPAHFAKALGNDPDRIFAFVRDHVAFEAYSGCLRGPRGTLLALAGNSVDRAALLASLLEASGKQVRYARGTLPQPDAEELVLSMGLGPAPRVAPTGDEGVLPDRKPAVNGFHERVQQDYDLIQQHLGKVGRPAPQDPAAGVEAAVREARDHYWVQMSSDGAWRDLDPAFGDSVPGRATTKVGETFEALPDRLFHRVAIRIVIEEYPVLSAGNEETRPARRVILEHQSTAADLSAADVVLVHEPEKWNGPAADLASALAASVEDTGQVKPVLFLGAKWVAGAPLRQRMPTGKGLGGAVDLLGGRGSRKPVPVATAESLEFDFIAPTGERETVVREVFDLAGRDRRGKDRALSSEEVRARTEAQVAPDLLLAAYGLYFTTGGWNPAHAANAVPDPPRAAGAPADIALVLRRINARFAAAMDVGPSRLTLFEGKAIRFYPDSPRVVVVELAEVAGRARISIDLRRPGVRAVAFGATAEDLFQARVFRGVAAATLERAVLEALFAGTSSSAEWHPLLSTSFVFERARAGAIPFKSLFHEEPKFVAAADTLARLREDTSRGQVVLVPVEPVSIGGSHRLAWWRIDPRSGDTIGVTDDGLHGTVSAEQSFVTLYVRGQVLLIATGPLGTRVLGYYDRVRHSEEFWDDFMSLIMNGWRFRGPH